jgi:hypothetical protein
MARRPRRVRPVTSSRSVDLPIRRSRLTSGTIRYGAPRLVLQGRSGSLTCSSAWLIWLPEWLQNHPGQSQFGKCLHGALRLADAGRVTASNRWSPMLGNVRGTPFPVFDYQCASRCDGPAARPVVCQRPGRCTRCAVSRGVSGREHTGAHAAACPDLCLIGPLRPRGRYPSWPRRRVR